MKNNYASSDMKVPWAHPYVDEQEKELLVDAFESTWISGGKYIEQFEEKFRNILGAAYSLTTSSGTAALHLSLLACNIKEGDEVIVPGYCFAAPVNMILSVGAIPVFVDIHPETWCMDTDLLKQNISSKTKAIIAVHPYGNVCQMDAIVAIAKENGIWLIEDAAEALFSKYMGQYVGTFGDIGCFSFQAAKTISTGEGGMVVSRHSHLYEKMKIIRSHGMDPARRYWHSDIGHNFRLTNLQAAIGCAQLKKMDYIIKQRDQIRQTYQSLLVDEPAITMQQINEKVEPVFWTTAIELTPSGTNLSINDAIDHLLKKGIESRPGFGSFSRMSIYNAPCLPISEQVSERIICLPTFVGLSYSQMERIQRTLTQFIQLNLPQYVQE